MRFLSTVVVALMGLGACAGDAPRSPEQEQRQACERAYETLCSRGCDCTPGPSCDLDDGVTTFRFDSHGECVAFAGVGCDEPAKTGIDFEQCQSAAESAACNDAPGSESAVFPEACK